MWFSMVVYQQPSRIRYAALILRKTKIYEGWNFNFGNTPLDWIQELLE